MWDNLDPVVTKDNPIGSGNAEQDSLAIGVNGIGIKQKPFFELNYWLCKGALVLEISRVMRMAIEPKLERCVQAGYEGKSAVEKDRCALAIPDRRVNSSHMAPIRDAN